MVLKQPQAHVPVALRAPADCLSSGGRALTRLFPCAVMNEWRAGVPLQSSLAVSWDPALMLPGASRWPHLVTWPYSHLDNWVLIASVPRETLRLRSALMANVQEHLALTSHSRGTSSIFHFSRQVESPPRTKGKAWRHPLWMGEMLRVHMCLKPTRDYFPFLNVE